MSRVLLTEDQVKKFYSGTRALLFKNSEMKTDAGETMTVAEYWAKCPPTVITMPDFSRLEVMQGQELDDFAAHFNIVRGARPTAVGAETDVELRDRLRPLKPGFLSQHWKTPILQSEGVEWHTLTGHSKPDSEPVVLVPPPEPPTRQGSVDWWGESYDCATCKDKFHVFVIKDGEECMQLCPECRAEITISEIIDEAIGHVDGYSTATCEACEGQGSFLLTQEDPTRKDHRFTQHHTCPACGGMGKLKYRSEALKHVTTYPNIETTPMPTACGLHRPCADMATVLDEITCAQCVMAVRAANKERYDPA